MRMLSAFKTFHTLTCLASSFSRRGADIGVPFIERMASFTRAAKGSSSVLLVGDQFEMVRPDAVLVGAASFANVIPFKALWWFANEKVVGAHTRVGRKNESAVALACTAKPQGAAIGTARIDLAPESFFDGRPERNRLSVPAPMLVMGIAPAACHVRTRATLNGANGGVRGRMLVGHREPILPGVTRPDVSASRPHSILPQKWGA